ncbi:hypothetical protein N7478_001308 [Penicillium angulare]|uniref:uncharacterized protein n=1 Tax=Penicillium angulare TaxID=116970 RepID=UPI00254203B4|nr:uncharacterized protein N7478_001308 [Penicillium angulare]KAJ5292057.1 hypothetical protein N7478_001308 [Penicillium angulare]
MRSPVSLECSCSGRNHHQDFLCALLAFSYPQQHPLASEDCGKPENTMHTSPLAGLSARRRKIAKACDFCREHRVRCEAATPCPQCVANSVTCNRSRSSQTTKRKSVARRVAVADAQLTDRLTQNTPLAAALPSSTASIPTPSSSENLAWTSHKTDSILGFIARMNAFCSSVSEISPSSTSADGPHPDQHSPFPTRNLQHTQHAECDLSTHQTKHLMKIFWTRLRSRMPIVQWEDLSASNEDIHGTSSPLQDAIKAYSLHSIYSSGLYTRLVGLNWPHSQKQDTLVGMSYFQRSLSAISQVTIFEHPTLSTMQCYCYLALYLLDTGHHQAAYNIVGLGLRISQSLNYMDERHGGYRECQLFRRVWWTLIHLDFRCSRHVGKPVSTNIDELIHLLPSREPEDVHHSNGLLYHTESVRLTAAALKVNESMDRHCSSFPKDTAGPALLELRASALSASLYHLQNWHDELPREKYFKNMHFNVPDVLLNSIETLNNDVQITEQCSTVGLLNTLLLLQYHNIMVGFHRVFIQFPNYPLIPKSTPKADAHAATALNHALIMINITHQTMAIHDFLHGISELYQYLWNAAITTIGFMLAYPYCYRCQRSREYLHLALEVFNSVSKENSPANRASVLIQQLLTKVDTLVQVLGFGQPTQGISTSSALSAGVPSLANSASHSVDSSIPTDEYVPYDLSTDMLGSWTDMINLDTWPSYCNEVNEAFMDPSEFFNSFDL